VEWCPGRRRGSEANKLVNVKGVSTVEWPTNPFAILTFISAPAVLTNASCVLLFGTGNRYGRAIDRVHELAEMIEKGSVQTEAEQRLRIRQLEASETRTQFIVQALTCFYIAVAGFVGSTLVSLIGAALVSAQVKQAVWLSFGIAFAAGAVGVFAMIGGAMLLAQESRFSFEILREERKFLTDQVQRLLTKR
jgi:Protein of unknown function (DUF2721)